jgi:hypothetical protein
MWLGAILFLLVFAIWAIGLVAALRVDKLERVRAGIPGKEKPIIFWVAIALVSILLVAFLGTAI